MGDGRIWGVIPVSEEDKKTFFAEPFEIKDDLTVYEAAMVVAGRHPNLRSVRGPNKGFYLEFLTAGAKSKSRQGARARRSVNVFYALRDAIKRDEIKPTKSVYLPNGDIDLQLTRIKTEDVARLCAKNGWRPRFLQPPAKATPKQTSKTGSKPKFDWPKIRARFFAIMNKRGDFDGV